MTTQLTLFTPPPAAPVVPAVPSGRYYRDGQFVLPEGEPQPPKGLFCVMDPGGAPRDALCALYVFIDGFRDAWWFLTGGVRDVPQ